LIVVTQKVRVIFFHSSPSKLKLSQQVSSETQVRSWQQGVRSKGVARE